MHLYKVSTCRYVPLSIVSLVNSNKSSLGSSTFMIRKQMMVRKSQCVVLFHSSHNTYDGGDDNPPNPSEIVIMYNV